MSLTTAFFIENALHMHVPLYVSFQLTQVAPRLKSNYEDGLLSACAVLQKYCRPNQSTKMASASQDMQLPSMCLLYDCTHIILLHVLAVQLALPRPNQTAFCCPFPLTCDEFSGTGLSRFPIVVLHACTC